MTDPLALVSAVSRMFAVVEGDADSKENIEQRARFYRTIPELDFPKNWDALSLEDKKIRLDKLDIIGLKQEEA